MKKSENNAGKSLAILGGLVAAAAGAYFVYGNKTELKKKAKKVKGWAIKAKGEVLQKLENLKAVDEDLYHKIIDGVLKKYQNVKNIDTTELASVTKELKSHWKNIKKELGTSAKETQKTVKKAKKAVEKVADQAKKAVTK